MGQGHWVRALKGRSLGLQAVTGGGRRLSVTDMTGGWDLGKTHKLEKKEEGNFSVEQY